jgi:hypothetical protein
MRGQPALYGGIAVLGGLVLAESLFLPWYGLELSVAGAEVGSTHSAWNAMTAMDVLLLLAAATAVAGGAALMRRPELSLVPLAAGVAGLVLSLVGLVDLPEADVAAIGGDSAAVGRKIGGFVALVASGGIAYAGYQAGAIRTGAPPRP